MRSARSLASVTLIVGLAACGAGQGGATRVRTQGTETRPANEVSFDLLGGAGSQAIEIDHVGDYVWKGTAVLPSLPDTFETSMKVEGVADVQNKHNTLVPAPGGYVLEVTFTVKSFSPGAAVMVGQSKAEGTPHLITPGSTP